MKSLRITALLVGLLAVGGLALPAHAYDPWSWFLDVTDGSGNRSELGIGANPSPNEANVVLYDPSTHNPSIVPLNGGLYVDGTGHFSITNVPEASIAGLVADLAGKASATHTHTTANITGLQAFVDSRIASTTKNSMSFGTTTRSLNTAFKISTASTTFVSYTVDIASTLSLVSGDTGTVTLEYADDSGFTTNVKTVQTSANGNTGTLAIGLGLTQTSTAALTGIIPANKWVRISTANTVGTPTFTYRGQQEVVMPLQ